MRFFEIDPRAVRVASDPKYFSYTTACARGHIAYTVGDARLTLAKQPPGQYDILLIDAFSSDSVPAHLLTVEAMRMYLSKLAPDGVLVMHLSNRNLDLMRPEQAVARAAGGSALRQFFAGSDVSALWASSEQAVIVGRSRAAAGAVPVRIRAGPSPTPRASSPGPTTTPTCSAPCCAICGVLNSRRRMTPREGPQSANGQRHPPVARRCLPRSCERALPWAGAAGRV